MVAKSYKSLLAVLFSSVIFYHTAYCDIPVVDGAGDAQASSVDNGPQQNTLPDSSVAGNSTNSTVSVSVSNANLTISQRIAKLEQQMSNVAQADLTNQIQTLKQQLQDLQGKLEIQQHVLDKLKQQQLTMYQDLNNRLDTSAKGASVSDKKIPASKKDHAVAANEEKDASTNLNDETSSQATSDTTEKDSVDAADKANSKADSKGATGKADSKERNAYQASFKSIKAGDYPKAISALKSYLKQYPDGQYAMNAHYWLGEMYYIQNESDQAITEFKNVIEHYPKDPKVADAKLKIGLIYFDNGQTSLSKKYLNDVLKNYPKTSAAKLAQNRLKQIST